VSTKPLNELITRIAKINRDNGWYEDGPQAGGRPFADDIALIHSEASEAYEEFRKGRRPDERYYLGTAEQGLGASGPSPTKSSNYFGAPNKPEGIPSELADIIIRVLDTCDRWNIDIDAVLQEKLAFNATRGYRHGGKVI
jgi:NTP pyrophosphatase (non-canonical NTP hydrolase)